MYTYACKHNTSSMVAVQGPDCGPPLIHTYMNSVYVFVKHYDFLEK
jgi:hypothetical protein